MDELSVARYSGLCALTLLASSLSASLHARTRRFRRALGLGAAAAALIHGVYAIASPLVEDLRHLFYEPHLRAGATALLILLVLFSTSFPKVVRVRDWDVLHRAVYFAALFALLHLWLSSHARRWDVIGASGTIAALFGIRLLRGVRRHLSR